MRCQGVALVSKRKVESWFDAELQRVQTACPKLKSMINEAEAKTWRVHVEVDPVTCRRYVERGDEPLMTIFWSNGRWAYPGDGWMDFGSVIIYWWIVAISRMQSGVADACDLPFMDGSFRLRVHRVGDCDSVRVSDPTGEVQTVTTLDALAGAVADAAVEMFAQLQQHGVELDYGPLLLADARRLRERAAHPAP
jgi:hypothetical protein